MEDHEFHVEGLCHHCSKMDLSGRISGPTHPLVDDDASMTLKTVSPWDGAQFPPT
jgi:hypothetical protein